MTEPSKDNAPNPLVRGLPTTHRYSPLLQLTLARIREFYREPEAIFWVYAFPLLIAVALGVAFRDKPVAKSVVDVQAGDDAQQLADALNADKQKRFEATVRDADTCRYDLKHAKTELILAVAPDSTAQQPHYEFWCDQNRTESVNARNAVDSFLARQAKALRQSQRTIYWKNPAAVTSTS